MFQLLELGFLASFLSFAAQEPPPVPQPPAPPAKKTTDKTPKDAQNPNVDPVPGPAPTIKGAPSKLPVGNMDDKPPPPPKPGADPAGQKPQNPPAPVAQADTTNAPKISTKVAVPNQKNLPTISPETKQALTELFSIGFKAADANSATTQTVKQIGNAASRAGKVRGIEQVEIDYAQGISLLYQGEFEAAVGVFRRLSRSQSTEPLGHLGLAYTMFATQKGEAAVAALESAIKIDPTFEPTLVYLAMVHAFMQAKPPAKFKMQRLSELVATTFAKLNPEQQARFRRAEEETRTYISGLPGARAKMLEPLGSMRTRAKSLETSVRKLDAMIATWQSQIQVLNNEMAAVTINVANARTSFVARSNLPAGPNRDFWMGQAQANLSAAVGRQYEIAGQIEGLQSRIMTTQQDKQSYLNEQKMLVDRIATEEARVDRLLSIPPFVLDYEQEKSRLLAGGSFRSGISSNKTAPAITASPDSDPEMVSDAKEVAADVGKNAPTEKKPSDATPSTSDDDAKAKSLMSIASSYRKNGNPKFEKETLEKVVSKYPDSESAKQARKRLEELKPANPQPGTPPTPAPPSKA